MHFSSFFRTILWIVLGISIFCTITSCIYADELLKPGLVLSNWTGPLTFNASDMSNIRYYSQNLSSCSEAFKPKGWSIYPCDPMRVFGAYPNLSFQNGYKIVGYQLMEDIGGNANLFVLPEYKPLISPDSPDLNTSTMVPDDADQDIMSYVSGDGSPLSYLQASLLIREIRQIGGFWHGLGWTTQSIIDDKTLDRNLSEEKESFAKVPTNEELKGSEWEFLYERPASFRPLVMRDGADVLVTFYTYTALRQRQVLQHTDKYPQGSYNIESNESTIISGGNGFLF